MKDFKDFNFKDLKHKDKTSGTIKLAPKTKEGPIGPIPPRSPKPRMTLTKLADTVTKLAGTVNKLAEMFVEFRDDMNSRFDKLEVRVQGLSNRVQKLESR